MVAYFSGDKLAVIKPFCINKQYFQLCNNEILTKLILPLDKRLRRALKSN